MHTHDLHHLRSLCRLQSTPGDEHAVLDYMKTVFTQSGYLVREHGIYAVTALSPGWKDGRPVLMACAHADSPGFVVSELESPHAGTAISLGSPDCTGLPQAVRIARGTGGHMPGRLSQLCPDRKAYRIESRGILHRGDRISYSPAYKGVSGDGLLHASFLDDRAGCWLLCRLAESGCACGVNLVLAVTCGEEMTGFGADVVAAHYRPDAVVCIDATYASEAQGIRMGMGPVVTASDKSTLLSPRICTALEARAKAAGVPLQFEYYNYSGTDARAFPAAGFCGPVYTMLLPTQGNHSPVETASVNDLLWMEQLLQAQACPEGVRALAGIWKA